MPSTGLIFVTILIRSFSEGTTTYKEVLVNAATNISCIPNETIQIQWHHTRPGESKASHLYAGGRFYASPNRGFHLEKDSNTGPYYLVIPHARTEDAGLYECKEDGIGSRLFGSTHLTVLEPNPVCESNMRPDGYVGPTTCRLQQEDMTFTCVVSFSGEPPQMIWKTLNGSQSFNASTCKLENGRKICSLIIRADPMYDGTIVHCQTTKSAAECSTKIIKINYFESAWVEGRPPVVEKNVDDKVKCSVKSNQVLQFKWTLLHDNQHVFLTTDEELLIQSPGLYRCVVEYHIRNVACNKLVTEVNALNLNTTPCTPPKAATAAPAATEATSAPTVIIVLATLVAICILGFIVLGITFYLYKIRKKKKKNGESSRNKEESNPNPEVETSLIDQSKKKNTVAEMQLDAV